MYFRIDAADVALGGLHEGVNLDLLKVAGEEGGTGGTGGTGGVGGGGRMKHAHFVI